MSIFGKLVTAGIVASASKIVDRVTEKQKLKDNNKYIKVGDFIYDLIGSNYKDAKEALEGYGFTNISYVVKKDLKRELKKGIFFSEKNRYADGEVEEISINGETDFDENNKFLPNARVAIVYHTYPVSKIDESKIKYYSKCLNCKANFSYTKSKPVCPYCGEPVKQ